MLSGDSPADAKQRDLVKECLYKPEKGLDEVRQFYESVTTDLIRQRSLKLGRSYHLDIVRE